ncbi:hypothetical protein T439DRAFT_325545 [Meredithblackwellia eburnea MCA 4105]
MELNDSKQKKKHCLVSLRGMFPKLYMRRIIGGSGEKGGEGVDFPEHVSLGGNVSARHFWGSVRDSYHAETSLNKVEGTLSHCLHRTLAAASSGRFRSTHCLREWKLRLVSPKDEFSNSGSRHPRVCTQTAYGMYEHQLSHGGRYRQRSIPGRRVNRNSLPVPTL